MPQYELNIRDYLRIFKKRKFIIFATFLIVSAASSIFFSKQKSVLYEASTTIKISEHKTIAGLLTEWVVYNPGNVMESEAKAIKGYRVMSKVAARQGMITADTPEGQVNRIVGELQQAVSAEQIGNTNLIGITVVWDDPRWAMELADLTAEVFIEENLLAKSKQARNARQFIQEQLAAIEARLLAAEEQLKGFDAGARRVKLAEPVKQQLVALEAKRMELLQKYTRKHPQVIQLGKQISEVEAQIDSTDLSQEDLAYSRLDRERQINQKLYAMLKEKLEEARINEAQKVSDISVVNPAVLPAAPISGGMENLNVVIGSFMGMVMGVALAFVLETLDTSIGTIEDVERVVKLPVLGVIPSFERIKQKRESFIGRLRNRVFAHPQDTDKEKAVRLIAHYEPRSVITEAYRNIHTNLKLDKSRRTILVTSSSPQEGKTTVCSNLGIVMAQVGLKTLIISTDLRRPTIDRSFGIRSEPGLNELIRGTATCDDVLNNITDMLLGDMSFEDIRMTAGLDNLWIIPPGRLCSNPVELLESKGMVNLVSKVKGEFDVVIFDAPPVLPVTDASLLAPLMDAVVIVYEIGRTSRDALMRTKTQLESVGGRMAGVILNHTRSEVEVMTNYPYYYRYKYTDYGSVEQPHSRHPHNAHTPTRV
ncbi:MAG: polysaccharide biosynthesis tyrosine autokinase [Candidatus Omnitrophica bacterium]|nr:polysaccharide biosynthesis tyrosine autokinase [Candidatus Omnitrophota bacterium]